MLFRARFVFTWHKSISSAHSNMFHNVNGMSLKLRTSISRRKKHGLLKPKWEKTISLAQHQMDKQFFLSLSLVIVALSFASCDNICNKTNDEKQNTKLKSKGFVASVCQSKCVQRKKMCRNAFTFAPFHFNPYLAGYILFLPLCDFTFLFFPNISIDIELNFIFVFGRCFIFLLFYM